MKNEDLQLISTLGQALYANPAQAQTRSIETVAAILTLPEISESQGFDRALELMLHQAERDGLRSQTSGINDPFFRLGARERFTLFLLHSGRASYKRLSRILGVSIDDVQAIAWSARSQIASSPDLRFQAPHPFGSSNARHSCPEYDSAKPWTQRLLDEEMGTQQLAFIQNHLADCSGCQRALSSTREFYYAIEKAIPLEAVKWDTQEATVRLQKSLRQNQIDAGNFPTDLTIREATRIFLSKPESVLWAAIFAGLLFALFIARGRIS